MALPASLLPGQQVAQTPPMGWNSWNYFATKVTDKTFAGQLTRWSLPA